MKRTLATITAAAIGVGSLTVGFAGPVGAQDIVVEEIRPDVPDLIDTLTNDELIQLWYDIAMATPDPYEPRFDGSDLRPGGVDEWMPETPPSPPPDTSAVPDHASPRPMVPIPH